jgi:CheY-like chemotaxis protein
LEVLKELQQRDPTRDIRVVFASAYALAVLGDLAQGADDPLHKPFDLADLVAKVQLVVLDFPTAADTGPNSVQPRPERGDPTALRGDRGSLHSHG